MIEIFAERLSALRKAEGLSVNELGKRVHISSSMISRYEAGERLPSYKASNSPHILRLQRISFWALKLLRKHAQKSQLM